MHVKPQGHVERFFDERVTGAECITISPNGKWVATSIQGGAVLWDMMSNNLSLRTCQQWRIPPFFPLSTGNISHIAFSPDGTRLLVASDSNTAHVWDRERCCRVSTIICDAGLVVGAWSSRCIALVTQTGAISTYDPATYQPVQHHALGNMPSHWSPVAMGEIKTSTRCPCLRFSPDDRWLAAYYTVNGFRYAWETWRVSATGNLTRHAALSSTGDAFGINTYSYEAHQVAFDSKSTRVAVIHGFEVHIWDIATATRLLSFDPTISSAGSVWGLSIAFSASGRHLLAMRNDKAVVEVWDAETGHFLNPLNLEEEWRDGHQRLPWMGLTFSPCGRYVLSSSVTARGVSVWRTEDGSLVGR